MVHSQGERIRHADLDAYLFYGKGEGYRAPGTSPVRPDEQVKVVGLRRRIAENMAASKRPIPHFTYVVEIDVTALEVMRSEEHTSELQSLMRTSYAAVCLTNQKIKVHHISHQVH